MNDIERLRQLITGGNCCISIVTFEEQYALEIIRQAALDLKQSLWIWSIAGGVKEGFLSDSLFIADTENPAQGLYHFSDIEESSFINCCGSLSNTLLYPFTSTPSNFSKGLDSFSFCNSIASRCSASFNHKYAIYK